MGRTETTDDRIRQAGWFPGTERDWQALSHDQRQDLAFAGCGCEVAYPTWEGPVDCVHAGCQVRRGEIPSIAVTNRILRYEMASGWLRFGLESTAGRRDLARLIRAIRRRAIATGVYDPWKLEGGWQGMVGAAISA
jgi:hypothetical protein